MSEVTSSRVTIDTVDASLGTVNHRVDFRKSAPPMSVQVETIDAPLGTVRCRVEFRPPAKPAPVEVETVAALGSTHDSIRFRINFR